MTIERSTE